MSFILTVLLFGFVATVYALKPESVSKQQTSVRLANAPVYRVVSDTAELAGGDVPAGPAKVLVAERSEARQPAGEVAEAATEAQNRLATESAEPGLRAAGQETAAPASLGLMPVAEGAGASSATPKAGSSNPTNLEIEELKDLGMASISAGGSWYTLQSAYVPASDKNTLNRRLMELSDAVGSREGIFIYQSSRSEGVFLGVCLKRFASAAQAKNYKKVLDKKLGYPSQLRSQKGLQTEVGF
ncbi:MAG: hypothetical protein LW629_09145 [Burkholderiales bacterium]|nr:hypothetical protein [Burkholderiales bacterium]